MCSVCSVWSGNVSQFTHRSLLLISSISSHQDFGKNSFWWKWQQFENENWCYFKDWTGFWIAVMMKMFLFGLQKNHFWGSFEEVFKILLRCAGRIIKRIDWVVSDWNQSFIGIQEEGMGGFFILSRFPFVEQIGFLLETKKTKRWESFDLQLTSSQHCSWIFNNNK